MAKYQKIISLTSVALLHFFVVTQSRDHLPGHNIIQFLSSGGSFSSNPLILNNNTRRETEGERVGEINDKGVTAGKRKVAVTSSRQFQERKLEFEPYLNEENGMGNTQIDSDWEFSLENRSTGWEESQYLGRNTHPVQIIQEIEAEEPKEQNQPQAVIENTKNSTIWNLFSEPGKTKTHKTNVEYYKTKTMNITTAAGEFPEQQLLPAAETDPTTTTIKVETNSERAVERPEADWRTESIKIESTNSSSIKKILHSNRPSPPTTNNKISTTHSTTANTKAQKKQIPTRISAVPPPRHRPLTKLVPLWSQKTQAQIPGVDYQEIHKTRQQQNMDNVWNGPQHSATYLEHTKNAFPMEPIGHENNLSNLEFSDSALHLRDFLSSTNVATASFIVISVMAISALLAGAAPFWQTHPFQTAHPYNPYDFQLPFYRRQFLPVLPISHPLPDQSLSRRVYYPSFLDGSGLRRRR